MMQANHVPVDPTMGSGGLKDRARSEHSSPWTKGRVIFDDDHSQLGQTTSAVTFRQLVKPTHVRRQSWDVLANNYATMRLEEAALSMTAVTNSMPNQSTNQALPQKKRRADGSVKSEQIWRMVELKDGLLQQATSGRMSKARLHMEMDLLKRRIAVIEAQERGRESRKMASRRLPANAKRNQHIKKGRHYETTAARRILDWEEAVLR